MRNSACGYLFLGATSREVAPDAAVESHNSRLVLTFHGRRRRGVVAAARQRRIATAERERTAFIASMGISRELDDLIRTVKFESLHVLTRSELYRFGIDTRTLVETSWTLEKGFRPSVGKFAMMKKQNGASFRVMEWRLSCENKHRVPLRFAGEIDEAAIGKSTIRMIAGDELNEKAEGSPVRTGKYEIWNGVVDSDMVKAMQASGSLQVREITPMPDDKTDTASFAIDMTGLASAWTQLNASCALAALSPISPWPPIPYPNAGATPSTSSSPSPSP